MTDPRAAPAVADLAGEYRRARRRLAGVAGLLAMALIWSGPALAGGEQRINAYLSGLTSLEADFEQFTFSADRTQMSESSGTLYLQRPGLFRWEYDPPAAKVIIADGKRVYLHDLELKQVSHQDQRKALSGTPALLLSDGGPIERHFSARAIESTDGRDWFELTPTDTDSDVVRVELGFRGEDLESLIMEDSFGQTTRLNFSNPDRNPRLDPALFQMEQGALDDFLQFD